MTAPGWREQAWQAFREYPGTGRDALAAALDAAEPLIRAEAAAAERRCIRQVIDPSKIEWMIHAFDLIDGLMVAKGIETNSEVQDDLRKLADLIEGDDR